MPVLASELTEAEVEQAVAEQGKEAVTGNVFIWFLCAIAFLKVSQKIDSFMASLGINVGNTGGNMMAELLIAGRSFDRADLAVISLGDIADDVIGKIPALVCWQNSKAACLKQPV